MKYSKEILSFRYHFEDNTNIYPDGVIEESHIPHWKRLIFINLTCEDLIKIGEYIKETFGEEGNYSHLLPVFNSYKGNMCLTVDVKEIRDKIIK